MRLRTAKLSALLFSSGLCALIYQTTWTRELRLVFGASTAASAAVLGIFMGGLGLGGWLFGKRAEQHPRPLALYGQLELAVSVMAAISPFLITGARKVYLLTGGSETLGMTAATLVRLLLSAIVLGGTTVLMGGTLPAMARVVEGPDDPSRRRVAVLLGANTAGAMAGVALSTFLLLEVLGNRSTLWTACALNALIAIIARSMSRAETPAEKPAAETPSSPLAAAAPARMVLFGALVVGLAFMLMELVWYRTLAPILGGSTYTFGLVLLMALLGIGLGGAAYAVFGVERRATLAGLAFTCGLEALSIALPLWAGDDVAVAAATLRPLSWFGFSGLVTSWALISLFVVVPGALVAGYQFPLLIALLGKGGDQVGRQVGLAYAWNTFGSIVGSLAGGFLLIPALGSTGTWRLAAAMLALLGFASIAAFALRDKLSVRSAVPLAASALAILCCFSTGPTKFSRHTPIGAGRADLTGAANFNFLIDWMRDAQRTIYWERDGVESTVGLKGSDGTAFLVNGKSDGNAFRDVGTQVMSGLLGSLLHPNPKRAMVIGLGTGSTAGWLGAVPSIERVDVAEIEPRILDVAKECAPVNQRVMENPKVHVFLGDAREFLLTSRDQYDIIFSEPSNPYRSGISSLYTHEQYEATRTRLGEHGIFVQWVQGYEVQPATVRAVLSTVGSVFPNAEVWATEEHDLVVVASASPIVHDVEQLRGRIKTEPFATALRVAWHVDDVEGFLSRFLAGPELVAGIAKGFPEEVNTDDLNAIEFAFSRSVGRQSGLSIPQMLVAARTAGSMLPRTTAPVDWDRVIEVQALSKMGFPIELARLQGVTGKRARLFGEEVAPAAFVKRWESLEQLAPVGGDETLKLARQLALAGDARADAYLDQLGAYPAEVQVLRSYRALKQDDLAGAGELALGALKTMHQQVWIDRPVLTSAFDQLFPTLARRDHALGKRLFDALKEPLPVMEYNDGRMKTRVVLAELTDFPALCGEALGDYGQWPPWRKEMLNDRVHCWQATHDPRFKDSERDLERFRESDEGTLLGNAAAPEAPAQAKPVDLSENEPAGADGG
ncbi:MAG: fused MFS/spermidine synthase [Myxococcaceae bacterium]